MKKLKPRNGARCGMVVPDGMLSGGGAFAEVKRTLLEEFRDYTRRQVLHRAPKIQDLRNIWVDSNRRRTEGRHIQQNFPVLSQATELLFLQHIMNKLKPRNGARCGLFSVPFNNSNLLQLHPSPIFWKFISGAREGFGKHSLPKSSAPNFNPICAIFKPCVTQET